MTETITPPRELTAAQRQRAALRKRILEGWRIAIKGFLPVGFNRAQITAQYLAHLEAETGKRLSRSTLYGWDRRQRAGGDCGLGGGFRVVQAEAPLVINFAIQPPLAIRVRTLAAGIDTPEKLAERVFMAWLAGGPLPRRTLPPAVKVSIVTRWREARASEAAKGKTRRSVDERFRRDLERREGIRISRGVLFQWGRKFDAGGAEALADHPAARPKDHSRDPFILEAARLNALPEKLSLAECRRRAAETAKEKNWAPRSYTAVGRYLRSLAAAEKRPIERPAMGVRPANEGQ